MNAENDDGWTALDQLCDNFEGFDDTLIFFLVNSGCDHKGNRRHPAVEKALAYNASRRAGAQAALEDIAFEDFAEIHELLDFLFLSEI